MDPSPPLHLAAVSGTAETGDVLGGVWFLLVSWVALRSKVFPRALNWLGLGVGTAALLSAVPGLGFLEVVVGLLQIEWFLWFGVATVRTGSAESPLTGEPERGVDRPSPRVG